MFSPLLFVELLEELQIILEHQTDVVDAGISKVVVGKIVEMEKQEGTHLTKCVVDCGDYGHDIRISTGAAI